MKYFIGFLMISAGFFMVWKTQLMMQWFGRVDWAERKLGSSWMFYKALGVGAIILAFMLISGDVVSILDLFFKR